MKSSPGPRRGIARQPDRRRTANGLPLSERHEAVLALLTEKPRSATDIAREAGMRRDQLMSTLYALADRGLARHHTNRRGWSL